MCFSKHIIHGFTLASPIFRCYSEWLAQYTLLPPLICDTFVSKNKHPPHLLNRLHVMAITNLDWIYTTNVTRSVILIHRPGNTLIHPDNIGGWVLYPPTYVFWEPNGSGPIFIK